MKRVQAIRTFRLLGPVMIMAVLLALVLVLPPTLAQEPPLPPSPTPPPPSVESAGGVSGQGQDMGVLADDGGRWEVGVHHSACSKSWDASASTSEGTYLYNKLVYWCGWGANNWRGRYRYGNTWAWEEDFKRSALGGKEYMYLDTVDLQFYVGHGSPGSFTFCNTTHDDKWLTKNDCYRSWGNNDNEWVALTSCNVLDNPASSLAGWGRCLRGGHLILGFKTGAGAGWGTNTQGYQFAKYLCQGYTVAQAWYKAADRTQSGGGIVRVLMNELSYLNDRPKYGYTVSTNDSYDWDVWVQTHVAGGVTYWPWQPSSMSGHRVGSETMNGTMPVFQYAPFVLAEARYEQLGEAFGVTTTLRLQRTGDDPIWVDQTDNREVEMDSLSGLYGLLDLDNMWTYTQTQRAQVAHLSPEAIVTADDARKAADDFLTQYNLMPADAGTPTVISDTISAAINLSGTVTAMNASLADEQATVWQVIYPRILVYTPTTTLGVAQAPITFTVIGPGALQKVYVGTTVASAGMVASNGAPILGAMGGWHEIEGGTGIQSVQDVPILTLPQIKTLYDELGDLVALNNPPVDADAYEVISDSLSYWEEGLGVSQAGSTPIYVLTTRFTEGITEVGVYDIAIPANETYMRPYAKIESAPTEMVQVGETVAFTATEATRTLADLDYDSSLDFVLGSGITGDYLYQWYVDSVEDANLIGAGRSITYTVISDVAERSGSVQQTIILKVTDTGNLDRLSTTYSAILDVYPRIFLPIVLKNYQ